MDATLREVSAASENKKTVAAMRKTITILMVAAVANAGTFALAGDSEEEDPPVEEIVVIAKRLKSLWPFPRPSPALPALVFVPPILSFAEESGERSNEAEDEEEEKENSDRAGCWRELTANRDAPLSGTFKEMRENGPHQAIDIAVPTGTKVYAAQSGTVERVKKGMKVGQRPTPAEKERNVNTVGNFIIISDAQGRTHRYLHLKDVDVEKGDMVSAGDPIGTSNDTGKSEGPHLHYDLSGDSGRIDPEKEFACDDEE